MKNETTKLPAASFFPLRGLFGLSGTHTSLISEVILSLFGRLKAGLNVVHPSEKLGVLSGLLRIIHRIRHVILLGVVGALLSWSTHYVDYGYFYTIISLKIAGVDISNCENLPFETMIKIATCVE